MENSIDSESEIREHKAKFNSWLITSVILGIVVLVLIFMVFRGGLTGNVVLSGDNAGKTLVQYLNQKTNGGVEFVSSTDKGYLYEVKVKYQGQEMPVYVTKDGKSMATSLIPLTNQPVMGNNVANTNTNAPQSVAKSDKPIVEAFIFSYCPYGTQFEKALIPVYDLLKNKADINIVAIGAMHGEYERVESLRQICIEKNYNRDKLFKYLKAFDEDSAIDSCQGTAACVDPLIQKIYTSLSITKNTIDNCMAKDAPALYDAQVARASSLGIGGSPTFVINGAQVQVNRSPDAIKEAICSAFTTQPEECSKTLSTSPASPGFG